MVTHEMLRQIAKENPDGFSINKDGKQVTSANGRWVIARRETQNNTIEDWDNLSRWAEESGFFGGWTDENTGVVYIDAVDILSKECTLDFALTLASEREQIAIYDLHENKTIYL
jgi:hypothetical protein